MKINENIIPLRNIEIDSRDFAQFRKYLNNFYGKKGVYPNKYGKDLDARDILKAIDTIAGKKPKHKWEWDSLDRELVRDELIKMRKFDYPTQEAAIKEISEVGKIYEDETKDPQEITVGDYQTRYFDMCPGASQLYSEIGDRVEDMDMAERSAKLQDALFAIEKHILEDEDNMKWDSEKYWTISQNIADQIMAMAEMMNLVDEHSYIQGHLETIEKALKGDEEVEPTKDTFEEGKKFKQVKKDKYGNHLEPQFKKGELVTYLGHPAIITRVNKEMGGVYSYDVDYNKGYGRTKVSNIFNKSGNELKESVMEGKKRFNTMYGVGKVKYLVNYHDGKKKHKDGSDFFDIETFKNQKDFVKFQKDLLSKGFVEESVNEADIPGKIPSQVKVKLEKAVSQIKDSNLTYPQRLKVLSHVLDSLNIDKKELTKMTTRLKGTLEGVNEVSKPSQVRSVISKVKKDLMKKWKQKGGYENFGDKEGRVLRDKFNFNPYGSPEEREIAKMIQGFEDWAMNYDGNMREDLNEADVVGKTIFSDGKGKLFFGYYKTDDAVEFVDYKTWKKLGFKDVSKGDTNKERVIKAILKGQKQFNKKVDFNMWSKKTNPSFEEKMDWFIQNGWINNINKGGIKESIDVVNEGIIQDREQQLKDLKQGGEVNGGGYGPFKKTGRDTFVSPKGKKYNSSALIKLIGTFGDFKVK